MKKYIADSGLQGQTEAMKMLRIIFKSDPEAKDGEADPPEANH